MNIRDMIGGVICKFKGKHVDRRLRKKERENLIRENAIADTSNQAQWRVCDRCGNIREARRRKA